MRTSSDRSEPIWFTIIRLLRWDKPAGRLILMIPALWGVVLAARGKPPLLLVGVIVLGSLVTSAAGCVVNDLWDRNIDPKVQRTRNRPLASRAVSMRMGIVIAGLAFFCAWMLATYLNPTAFWLCVAAVPVIILYPGAKRIFPVPQLVLAIAWGFAILISWSMVSCGAIAAPTACLGRPTWLLWGATLLWTLGFDTIYAMSDREDDRRIGVNSSALFFGQYAPHAVGLCFTGTALLFLVLSITMQLNPIFWVTLAIASLLWAQQYYRLIQKTIPPATYAQLFQQNVVIGFILLVGMILGTQG
jgi:4-hydroxybenzoate polyprenyltransferase